jgi:hypothetical protein
MTAARKRRAHRHSVLAKALWWCAGLALAAGLILRLLGSDAGLVVATIGLLVGVVAAWVARKPREGTRTDVDPWAA